MESLRVESIEGIEMNRLGMEELKQKREKLSIVSEGELCEGEFIAKGIDIELIRNRKIVFNGKEFKKNVLKITFELENGHTKDKEVIFSLTENSELGRFATAVKGYFPKKIDDIAEELLNKELIVEIKKNVKGEKTYYNIADFKHSEADGF